MKLNSNHKIPSTEPFHWLDFHSNHLSVIDLRKYIKEDLLPYIKDLLRHDPSLQEHFKKHGWIFAPDTGGYDYNGVVYPPIPPWSIPIIIDIGGLTTKSKEAVTKQVWNIVKKTIQERTQKNPKNRKRTAQIGDASGLDFIYRIKDKIFKQYLKWYDLHMWEDYKQPNGFNFRQIAFLDYAEKKDAKRILSNSNTFSDFLVVKS